MSSVCCTMPQTISLKSTPLVNNSLNVATNTKKSNSNQSFYSFSLQEKKEYECDLNLVNNLTDLKVKVTKLRNEFPSCNLIKSDMNYFQGSLTSTFEFKTVLNLIRLNVVTNTQINNNLKMYFETVLDEHYNCVLNGFKQIEALSNQI